MALRLFNSLGRKLQEFTPIHPGKVGLYTCGPTVYNFAHIGNLKTYIFEDILRRTLEYLKYDVTHVMNVTDVGHLSDDADQGEDRMMIGARKTGKTVWEIADFFTNAFFRDLEHLHIVKPTIICKATEHIQDMIDLIVRIEKNGFTYFKGGNLYFDISKFPDYGKLANLNLADLKAGARIEVDENKKNPHDFVLWFTQSKFEHQAMLWDSPWGRGYPGWHIECSAMSIRYLGETFDIHCGGVDHIQVHHTNEIAQAEAATGKKWVNYWLHGEFLVTSNAKMSKSLENFITLNSLKERGYDALDYRYFCLGAHYRKQQNFSFEDLDAARTARNNLLDRVARLKKQSDNDSSEPIAGNALRHLESFQENLLNDLNMPKCLSDLWNLLKDEKIEPHLKLRVVLEMDKVFGLNLEAAHLEDVVLNDKLMRLLNERDEARINKDYTRADEIRVQLEDEGIIIEDTPDGVRWRRK
ncbi:MAG: cysteine--tRNA ligase [Spirochaetales bacterium]|nr:cysteine--tRNA ligase [Spirochaetales bacterium]